MFAISLLSGVPQTLSKKHKYFLFSYDLVKTQICRKVLKW